MGFHEKDGGDEWEGILEGAFYIVAMLKGEIR
jgi:hypothetical protein